MRALGRTGGLVRSPALRQAVGLLALSLGCALADGMVRGWFAITNGGGIAGLMVSARRQGIVMLDEKSAIEDWALGRSVWVDVRSAKDYERGHIPWAISVPWEGSDPVARVLAMTDRPDRRITVYCGGPNCDEAWVAAQALRKAGLRHVQWFVGGWQSWTSAQVQARVRLTEPQER